MKLAGVSITYNDGYKIKEWARWYEEYKNELYRYIIVDNGSTPDYLQLVESIFKDAIIIKRGTNGGCTYAYNDGIKKALSDSEVTHIALIGNDIRLEAGALTKCIALIDSDNELGMVAPILLNADSYIVADYGCSINKDLSMEPYGVGVSCESITPDIRYCEAVTGGMNVARRSFYESQVGLQDEKLFMYSDEVDMGLRAHKVGVKMAVTKYAKSWHQHINPQGAKRRLPYSNYLIARNKVYLGKKHFGTGRQLYIFASFIYSGLKSLLKNLLLLRKDQLIYPCWTILGAINGLTNNMRINKYSSL